MRCKPHELCIVEGIGPFRGTPITVTWWENQIGCPEWHFVPRLFHANGDEQLTFYDHVLRPIRGQRQLEDASTPAGATSDADVAWG